ncbi:MAG: hypothetical protein JXA93_02750 [Anaerolineae bacterium]|nr:hypothetical protein [Anaerolineae bacterium]
MRHSGTRPGEIRQDREPAAPHYTSFILRCWVGEEGQVHARLIDLRTGVGHVVGRLALLPDLVRHLVATAPPAGTEPQAGDSPRLDQIDPHDRR